MLKFFFINKFFFPDEMKDKVIWITGASTGIGAACAIQCAKVGAKLVLSARNETLLWEIKQKCLGLGANHLLTSLMADLRQDIKRVSSFCSQ